MRPITCARVLILALATLVQSTAAFGQDPARPFRVVGYLPEYRLRSFNPEQLRYVTHVAIFSAEPTAEGAINRRRLPDETLARAKEWKQTYGVKLLFCVGGWGRSDHFPKVAADAELRARFIRELVALCREQDLDGVDLDWEHPKAGTDEVANFGTLLAELHQALRPHGLELSIAVAAWQELPTGIASSVDAFHLMAYDHGKRHSTYENAVRDVQTLIGKGIPANQIILGVPFYGRAIEGQRRDRGYDQIVQDDPSASDRDETAGIFYNGVPTIERKTAFAREKGLAGVMIWELGQDTSDDRSLLRAIGRAKETAVRPK